ncbi:MAG: nucleoside hydrolase [Anaerolineae bacterium]|nr:nucleoside hydrolase [Anaerolineae bacterium]
MTEIIHKRIHLDTDIGGDLDDLCALALLLRWPGVDITGITTMTEEDGRRVGYVNYVLGLEGRQTIPIAAGVDVSAGTYRYKPGFPPDDENWPEPIPRLPGTPDAALALVKQSIEQGAVVVGIGPFTNLALLERQYPGILKQADLVLMGGWVFGPRPGFPQWTNDYDYNLQLDVDSAHYVLTHSHPTIVPLEMSAQTALRRAYLTGLAQAGVLGRLIVRQAEFCAHSDQFENLYGATCPGLPDDIINFQHDPLACAIALGWRQGVTIQTVPLQYEIRDGWLHETPAEDGHHAQVVTEIDGEQFNEFWYRIVSGQSGDSTS